MMQNDNASFEVQYRGSAADFADEVWRNLTECPELSTSAGPEGLGRRKGATLGIGTVIVTIVATTAVQTIVKKGVDWLIQYIRERIDDTEDRPDVAVHLAVEFESTSVETCVIEASDNNRAVRQKLTNWKASIAAHLNDRPS